VGSFDILFALFYYIGKKSLASISFRFVIDL